MLVVGEIAPSTFLLTSIITRYLTERPAIHHVVTRQLYSVEPTNNPFRRRTIFADRCSHLSSISSFRLYNSSSSSSSLVVFNDADGFGRIPTNSGASSASSGILPDDPVETGRPLSDQPRRQSVRWRPRDGVAGRRHRGRPKREV